MRIKKPTAKSRYFKELLWNSSCCSSIAWSLISSMRLKIFLFMGTLLNKYFVSFANYLMKDFLVWSKWADLLLILSGIIRNFVLIKPFKGWERRQFSVPTDSLPSKSSNGSIVASQSSATVLTHSGGALIRCENFINYHRRNHFFKW